MSGNSTINNFPIEFCRGIFACNDSPGLPTYNAKQPTGLALQLVLCSSFGLIFFLLFCYLRVRWPSMYAPRLNMKKQAPKQLPSSFFGWILPVLKTSNPEVLEKVGLDAVVMLQFLLMAAKIFALCGFFGTVVLYPISRMGGDLLNSTDPNNNRTNTSNTLFDGLLMSPPQPTPAPTSHSFLWIYLFFTYFFCLATFYFTFLNYRDYVRIRQEFMLRIGKSIPSRTVLVTGIPPSLRSDQKLADYFEKLGIGVVDSVHIIRHVNRLLDFIKERALSLRQLETAYARFFGNPCHVPDYDPDLLLNEAEHEQHLKAVRWPITHSSSDSDSDSDDTNNGKRALKNGNGVTSTSTSSSYQHQDTSIQVSSHNSDTDDEDDSTPKKPLLPIHRRSHLHGRTKSKQKTKKSVLSFVRPLAKDGFMGIVGKQVDAIEHFTEKFNEMDVMVAKARKHGKFLPTSVGFVTFEDCMSASIACQVLIDSTPFRLKAQLAPEPRNVIWENIAMHERERWTRKVLISGVLLLLVFFWVIPISYFSALTNENSLRYYFPWLMDLASKNKILRQIIQSFLPTLGVVIFMAILPMILNALSVIEGFQTRSEAEESTFSKYFFFLLFNVLLVFTASSALFKTLHDILEDPSQIANILATKLPQVAPFFVNYTVIQGMMLLPIQLLQIGPVILQTFHRVFIAKSPRDYAEVLAPRMYNYGWGYPMPVFLFVVLLVYSTITPLILVFGTFYYCLAYLVLKYQLLYVYFHPYEVAGRMWPLVFSRIIVGLLLFETLAAGLFVLNKAYTLGLLCMPLVLMTLLFNFVVDRAYQKSTQFLPLELLSQKFGPLVTSVASSCPPNLRPEPSRSTPNTLRHHQQPLQTPSFGASNPPAITAPARRRRTVLDEDDYVAQPRKYTNFKEPPMTLLDGILNTGMKRYAHPAFLGVLPQLWLPVKATDQYQRQGQYRGFASGAGQRQIQAANQEDSDGGDGSDDEDDDDNNDDDHDGGNDDDITGTVNHDGTRQQHQSHGPSSTHIDIPTRLTRNMIPPDNGLGAPGSDDIPSDEDSMEDDADTINGTYYHHPERRRSKSILSRSYGTS